MPINLEKRKEILLQSFDLMKDNWKKNNETLGEIIKKMWPIDTNMASEMWIYLIKKNSSVIESDSYWLTDNVIHEAQFVIDEGKIAEIVVSNEFLKNTIFGKSESVGPNCAKIIGMYLSESKLSIANELLGLIKNNKASKKHTFAEIMLLVIYYTETKDKSDDLYDFFMEWAKQIENEEDLAKVKVRLLNLF